MQGKNFIGPISRNEPSDLLIRKPAALLSGNGTNRIIFLFAPITTENIFSRKKFLSLSYLLCRISSLPCSLNQFTLTPSFPIITCKLNCSQNRSVFMNQRFLVRKSESAVSDADGQISLFDSFNETKYLNQKPSKKT